MPISSGAADNAAQAKARQALEKMYQTIDAQAASAAGSQAVASDSETTARARQALRAKMAEIDAAALTQPAPGFSAVPAPSGQDAKIDESRAALRNQMRSIAEQEAVVKPAGEKAVATPAPLKGLGQYEKLEAPAVPFSPEQQQKLSELLRKYRADEISPEQYHAERARIISGK